MRVLCITSHSDRPEAETFIGLHRLGVAIKVLCPTEAPHFQRLVDAGVDVQAFALKSRFDRVGTHMIRQELETGQFDILHLFNNKAVQNGLRAAKGLPIKIIAYRGIVGNVSFLDPISWLTYLNPRVDRIICVANAIREYFLSMRLLGLRVPPQKVVTIYKGHDINWYQDPTPDLGQFGIPPDAFVVGTVANLRPRKGIDVFVESIRHLPEHLPIHYLLVGKMESEKLDAAIRACPQPSRIHRTGFRRDAPALMGACDVAVLPALKREGLPKTIIEAMAYGTPPIVTDAGGSPELIEHQKSGLVVPPGDAVAIADAVSWLQDDDARRRAVGEQARERIRDRFRIENTIEQTLALYRELIHEPSAVTV